MIAVSYNLAGAAEATGMAPTKIRQRIREGKIVPRYEGKDILIERDELERYLSQLPTERGE